MAEPGANAVPLIMKADSGIGGLNEAVTRSLSMVGR